MNGWGVAPGGDLMANAHATGTTGTGNPIADVTTFWRISGVAVAAVAVLGILLNLLDEEALLGSFLTFDWTHNIVHVVLAAIALVMGFGTVAMNMSKMVAKVFGAVYLLLGVAGFISAGLFGLGDAIGLELEIGENLVHLVIGAWGLYAGMSG